MCEKLGQRVQTINGGTATNVDDSTGSRAELRYANPRVTLETRPPKRVNNLSNASHKQEKAEHCRNMLLRTV
jgi:hypothetical protein